MIRKPLGRGLGALLSAEAAAPAESTSSVDIRRISPNPMQPRLRFDDAKLAQLVESIKENGIVQPLVLRRFGADYQLIAGERRLRAAELAGLTEVPAVIRYVPDDKLLELALIENIQREELNPIEEASAYKKLIESVGLTQDELAKRVGRDRSYITNYLRLLRLPADIQKLLIEGQLSTGHARSVLGIEDQNAQVDLANRIVKQGMSVRETERVVRQVTEGKSRVTPEAARKDPNVQAAEIKLMRRFGTKVRIVQPGQAVKGKIEIDFFDGPDLQRIYSLLMQDSSGGI